MGVAATAILYFDDTAGDPMTGSVQVTRELIRPGAHALVVGLGRSGMAAARLLVSKGLRVSVSEGRGADRLEPGCGEELAALGVELETGGHSEAFFSRPDVIVVSPGVPLELPALANARLRNMPMVGELGLAALLLETPCVAITGTNGKSTVTTLVGGMLQADGKKVFVGGNIGTPLSEYVLGPQDAEVAVLEVSSFQIDTAGPFRPDVGVLLNITPDHLERYASFAAYGASKWALFAMQQPNDKAVLNLDDAEVKRLVDAGAASLGGRPYYFGNDLGGRSGAMLVGSEAVVKGLVAGGPDERYTLAGTGLDTEPNLHNALAAILAARLMGCSENGARKGLAAFSALPHRLALVAEIDGVQYFDDSKATNVGAVLAALQGMSRPVVLIAGGRDKGGGYGPLAEQAGKTIKSLVVLGEAKEQIAAAFAGRLRVEVAADLQDAVERAAHLAQPGDAVLLSPACASFDMFTGYAQRGEKFREAVQALRGWEI